ncbi:hypothetical protein [Chromohalobacter moromii]|uniref:Uncharacterized protein n=1 Tax=Chromohalobacter moromii TaxID=2860329 RepID=A0A9X2X2V6_9GAMM|nr:hypothetical protein [Chromohalobacter moromii]MCK2046013.1 hypothetical protein [Chromohalobacter moromii]MCT8505563.1 hypothetical protein [Chromohalobacter moromii]
MNPGQMWKFHGNLNRIIEMDAAGVGANAIAGVFQDHNINISANDVRSMLKANKELTKKALPKAEAAKLIDQNDLGGFQPA